VLDKDHMLDGLVGNLFFIKHFAQSCYNDYLQVLSLLANCADLLRIINPVKTFFTLIG